MLVKRNANVLASSLPDGNMALLNVDTGRYLTFDETTSAIWNRTEKPISLSDLISSLLEEYDADPAVLEKDVRSTLETLAEKQVMSLSD